MGFNHLEQGAELNTVYGWVIRHQPDRIVRAPVPVAVETACTVIRSPDARLFPVELIVTSTPAELFALIVTGEPVASSVPFLYSRSVTVTDWEKDEFVTLSEAPTVAFEDPPLVTRALPEVVDPG